MYQATNNNSVQPKPLAELVVKAIKVSIWGVERFTY